MDSTTSKRVSGWSKAFRRTSTTTAVNSQRRQSSSAPPSLMVAPNTLEQKYGRPNKILSNEGAGGSILLVTRQHDNTTFTVKRFTSRHQYEDEQLYTKKIVAEYYVGAQLQHPNIISTLDLFKERGQWFQVMEYAPHCLFDRVMSRKMSIAEINCAFMQILAGTDHMHRSGFAHRDLKLENVVTTDGGIMKLIDFGSAIICKDPGRKHADGFVGSLSYMAPEAAAAISHDPQKADVWSLAIVYCCMILGRFPWKSPDCSNEAFTLFAGIESPKTLLVPPNPPSRASSTGSITIVNVSITEDLDHKQKITEKVLGPWGLLRQLPSESRDVIKAMLCINPDTRPTLQQVRSMSWVAQAQRCTEDVDGQLQSVTGHQHHG